MTSSQDKYFHYLVKTSQSIYKKLGKPFPHPQKNILLRLASFADRRYFQILVVFVAVCLLPWTLAGFLLWIHQINHNKNLTEDQISLIQSFNVYNLFSVLLFSAYLIFCIQFVNNTTIYAPSTIYIGSLFLGMVFVPIFLPFWGMIRHYREIHTSNLFTSVTKPAYYYLYFYTYGYTIVSFILECIVLGILLYFYPSVNIYVPLLVILSS